MVFHWTVCRQPPPATGHQEPLQERCNWSVCRPQQSEREREILSYLRMASLTHCMKDCEVWGWAENGVSLQGIETTLLGGVWWAVTVILYGSLRYGTHAMVQGSCSGSAAVFFFLIGEIGHSYIIFFGGGGEIWLQGLRLDHGSLSFFYWFRIGGRVLKLGTALLRKN